MKRKQEVEPFFIGPRLLQTIFDEAYRKGYRRAIDSVINGKDYSGDYGKYVKEEAKNWKVDMEELIAWFEETFKTKPEYVEDMVGGHR